MPVADGSIIIDTAIDSRSAKGDLDSLMAKFRSTANQAGAIGQKLSNSVEKSFSSFSKASAKLGELDSRIAKLKQQIASMKETPVKTSAFSDLEKEIEQTRAKLAKVDAQKQRFLATGGGENKAAFQRMEYDANQLAGQLDRLLAKKGQLESSGQAYTTQDTTPLEEKLTALLQKRVQLANDLGINYDGVKNKIGEASTKMAEMQEKERKASDSGEQIKKKFEEVARNIQKAAKESGGLGTGFKGLLKTVLRYGFAIRSTYILVNKLKSFTKEGLKNMALYSSSTNSAISSMLTALNTLKNSLGAAFAPIVETVAPYVSSLINMLAGAVTSINQFISALIGRSTYTKALVVQQDDAASLNKTAGAADKAAKGSENAGKAAKKAAEEEKKFLAGFDEIEKIPEQDKSSSSSSGSGGSGSGSGAGGAGQALQFVTESIPGLVTNWADMLKEAWNKADFTEIGGIIGAKLRDALDSIKWDDIKKTAQRTAKSLATLLNGFLEAEGLSQSIGRTVAEAFNTGFEFVNTFLENFHFDSFGKFISSGIQEAFKVFDWGQVTRALSNALKAAMDFGTGLLQGINWKELPKDIADAIVEAVKGFDFKGTFKSAGKLIGAALTAAIDLVSGIADLASGFFSGIADYFKKHIDDAKASGGSVADGILKGIADAFLSIGNWIKTNILDPFIKGFKETFGIHSPAKEMEEPGKFVGEGILSGIASAFSNILDWLKKNIVEPIKENLQKAWDATRTAVNVAVTFVKDKAQKLQDLITEKVSAVVNFVKNKAQTLSSLIGDKTSALVNFFKDKNDTLVNLIGDKTKATVNFVKEKSDSLANLIGTKLNALVNFYKAKKQSLATLIGTKLNALVKFYKAKKQSLATLIGNKLSVAINLVRGWKGSILQWITGAKNGVVKIGISLFKSGWASIKKFFGLAKGGIVGANGSVKAMKNGGILQHGVVKNIPQYAGGTLNAGTLFAAGERGPEVVGHIGGRTEVLNKSQIASAIYQAMVSAMAKMGGYFSRMTSALANIPPAIQTMSMTQPDFVLEIPQMATGTVLPPQATISTQDAAMLRDALVGLTTALQGAQVSGRQGTTQNNITLELPGVGVLGRAMVKYIDGEAKQGRYPLSGYM